MRIAHLILTYTDPKQTERTIRMMYHKNFDFYIHVDKKFDISSYLFLSVLPNVFFIKKRADVRWSGFSTVKATFQCIKEIVDTGIDYKYINFLSGQDYPIKPANFINDFFVQHTGKEFLSYRDIRNDWTEGLIRMEKYFFSDHNFTGKYFLENLVTRLLPKRKIPYNMHPYGKSMFWMLSPGAAMYVVNKVEHDRKLMKFFALSWASDEFVFQTILLNSPYKDKVVNNNYRYIDWSKGGARPKLLDETDINNIAKSGMLFARKFDMGDEPEILDLIDSNLIMNGLYPKNTDL